MRILYISSVCAQSRFDRLVEQGFIDSQFQNQKFHHLILKGLREISEVPIEVVSFYPINRNSGRKLKYEAEEENGVQYVYPGYTNIPILHHISKCIQTFRFLKKRKRNDSVIVCNIMNFDECLAALLFRFFYKTPICAITADVPGLTSGAASVYGSKWKHFIRDMVYPVYRSMSNKYDAYMFLAPAMNTVVNTKAKPYIIVEGLSDLSIRCTKNDQDNKYSTKTIMYAGGIHREYGIELLVSAFQMLDNQHVELHIYGKGNYEEELKRVTVVDHRVKYYGTKPNSEIVKAQIRAHLLVNPRTTEAEFVKYSFPSKIMESMASGTPLLTTRIPSIPNEYYPYIYTFDEETKDGFYNTLCSIIALPNEKLHEKGLEAKDFIITKKNYKIQSEKLLELLKKIVSY